jgi:hypothetical protein
MHTHRQQPNPASLTFTMHTHRQQTTQPTLAQIHNPFGSPIKKAPDLERQRLFMYAN